MSICWRLLSHVGKAEHREIHGVDFQYETEGIAEYIVGRLEYREKSAMKSTTAQIKQVRASDIYAKMRSVRGGIGVKEANWYDI